MKNRPLLLIALAIGAVALPLQSVQAFGVAITSHDLKRTTLGFTTVEECEEQAPYDNCHLFYVGCEGFDIYLGNRAQESVYDWHSQGYEIEVKPLEGDGETCIIHDLFEDQS